MMPAPMRCGGAPHGSGAPRRTPRGGAQGAVLVAVLLLTAATWALLAALLGTAFLHHRLAQAAERAAVAGAAAEREVAAYLDDAERQRRGSGAWPTPQEPADLGACALALEEVATAAGWWRVRVVASFEGARAAREGTVHAPP